MATFPNMQSSCEGPYTSIIDPMLLRATPELRYWVWFHELRGIPVYRKRILLATYGDPKVIFHLPAKELQLPTEHHITDSRIIAAQRIKQLARAHRMVSILATMGIGIVTCHDVRYRWETGNGLYSPILYYYRGTVPDPIRPMVQVVYDPMGNNGNFEDLARVCSHYRDKGYIVGIGLSLEQGPNMLCAVLDHADTVFGLCHGGLDRSYPLDHWEWFDRVSHQGVMLSPYPLGVLPTRYRAILSDRMLSSWCNEIVLVGQVRDQVVESTLHHGFALHRPVYRYRGNIGEASWESVWYASEDTPHLLRMHPSQHEPLDPTAICSAPIGSEDAVTSLLIFDLLHHAPLATSEIADALGIRDSVALTVLIDMELCGSLVSDAKGMWRRRKSKLS